MLRSMRRDGSAQVSVLLPVGQRPAPRALHPTFYKGCQITQGQSGGRSQESLAISDQAGWWQQPERRAPHAHDSDKLVLKGISTVQSWLMTLREPRTGRASPRTPQGSAPS